MTEPNSMAEIFATLNQKLDAFGAMQSQVETLVAKVESSQHTIEALTGEVAALRSQINSRQPKQWYSSSEASELLNKKAVVLRREAKEGSFVIGSEVQKVGQRWHFNVSKIRKRWEKEALEAS